MIAFSGFVTSYHIVIIGIVNSRKISVVINEISWSQHYDIFLNFPAKILTKFGGLVIKNHVDNFLYCFPESSEYKIWFYEFRILLYMLEVDNTFCENSKNGIALSKQSLERRLCVGPSQ